MRADMNKVIVERPRSGWRIKTRRQRLKEPDDLPSKVGVRRYAELTQTRSKHLNEHLGPLKRYLGRQRGRPWNKVHGEIRAVLDTRNEVQAHILSHLENFIAIRVHVDRKGRWLAMSSWDMTSTPDQWRQALYVDPHDGIIKETEKLRRKLRVKKRRPRADTLEAEKGIVLDSANELHRWDGICYHFKLAEIASSVPNDTPHRWIMIAKEPASPRYGPAKEFFWRRIVTKRQLGKAELKKYGLRNDP